MTDLDDATFALCLTHDVDRIAEGARALYYATRDRDPRRLRTLLPGRDPYWQFDHIRRLEDDLGVRSAFYFLVEKRLFRDLTPREWFSLQNWILYQGRYDVRSPPLVEAISKLDKGGWEVGLHGSYGSYADTNRLRHEKEIIESVLGHEIMGGRQHYLNLSVPDTWERHTAVGLRYDTTIGSSSGYGFDHGYGALQPFEGSSFLVFPLTLMDITLPDVPTDPAGAWAECEDLLETAREHAAIMTIDWHQRSFSEQAFPNQTDLYRSLIERAQEMGAWVGPPGELYEYLQTTPGAMEQATDGL
jgi:hypothetical protein